MTVETGALIRDLNTAYPEVGSPCSDVAAHLRLIKSTVKANFPNMSGAMTASHVELNYLAGMAETVAAALSRLSLTVSALSTRVDSLSVAVATARPLVFSQRISISATVSATPLEIAIPSTARRIRVDFPKLIGQVVGLRLGTAAAFESVGYLYRNNLTVYVDGFYAAYDTSATATFYGSLTLLNTDNAGLEWACVSEGSAPDYSGIGYRVIGAGEKTLAGALTRIQLLRAAPYHFLLPGSVISVSYE